MKKLIILTVMLGLAACAPMPVKENAPVESVINMPGFSKDQIYAGTKSWIAENFRSAKAVIQDDDKDAGRIIGNGNIKYPCSGFSCMTKSDWKLDFTMRVDIKDQKMRVTFTNLGISFPPSAAGLMVVQGENNMPLSGGEMDEVQPSLDKMRDQLVTSIQQNKAQSNF